MSRYPDHQKQEAVRSRWDMDGHRIRKSRRNKAKGRGLDRRLIRDELRSDASLEDTIGEQLGREADEASYCHHYGPCAACLARQD